MSKEEITKILSAPTVAFKEVLENPGLLEGKTFWVINPSCSLISEEIALRKVQLDNNKLWVVSDLDPRDDFEELYSKHFTKQEIQMHPDTLWMLKDGLTGHIY